MARSDGGWSTWTEMRPKPMPAIDMKTLGAPTASNGDCPWSLGILNLTQAEVGTIRQFVRIVQMARTPGSAEWTASAEMRAEITRGVPVGPQPDPLTMDEQRTRWVLTGQDVPAKSADPEPVPAGNRFSGLDIE